MIFFKIINFETDYQKSLRDDGDLLLKKINYDEEIKSHNGENQPYYFKKLIE